MKKYIRAIYMIGFATLISHSTIAREKIGGSTSGNNGGSGSNGSGVVKPSNEEKGANCTPTSTHIEIADNDVRAYLEVGGTMFQNRLKGTPGYEVPKTVNNNGPKAIFAGSLWMGGKDASGALKVAAVRFRQDGNDFWAGPLSVDLTKGDYDPTQPVTNLTTRAWGGDVDILPSECARWDKFFEISKATVISYSIWWAACDGNSPTANSHDCSGIDPESLPKNDDLAKINSWPAHGSAALNQDYFLAPFYDNLSNPNNIAGKYEPDQGDTPWYDDILGRDDIECGVDRRISLFGDNTVWWIFNDKGNIHTESKGDPIGMEIRAQAFTFGTSDEINRMTFYNYELVNRGTQTLANTFFAQYIDSDLGGPNDDYVGCDVSRGLGYAYNGDLLDLTDGASVGYGSNPPAIGVDFFEGPYQDADGIDNPGPVLDLTTGVFSVVPVSVALAQNGIVYKGIGVGYGDTIVDNERFGMRRFTYFTNGAPFPKDDPSTAVQYYNYMQGRWQDGSDMYYGGDGHAGTGVTGDTADYMFPGDSDPFDWSTAGAATTQDWTEVQAGNPAGDRRFVQAAGPFTLEPGAMNNLTVGIVYGRSGEGNLFASVEAMKTADTKAQALFDACFRIIDPPTAPKVTVQELENQVILLLENPATGNNKDEEYNQLDDINIPPTNPDSLRRYKFEGYQIYQLVNGAASVSDIGDNTKARLVDQCDIKNNVERIVNFEYDEALGFSVPTEKVKGANQGIRHSYKITEDLFASGNRTLVNHKTYYFVAVAYAYNQFKAYDPNDPTKLDGQKKPYISSRLGYDNSPIRAVSAVPHNPTPEADGTFTHIEFGSTPQITRLDGSGNGNRDIALNAASRDYIRDNGRMTNPTYDYGRGPINVKVIDPLNIQGGYYELKFRDYVAKSSTQAADTAQWTIYRYESNGGAFIDSIEGDRLINSDNEQIIPEWGISVQIFQKNYTKVGTGTPNDFVTNPISGTISFADSSKRWLTFIADNDLYQPTNWIRSGTYDAPSADCIPTGNQWVNPCKYIDEVGYDDNKLFPKLLSGGASPQRLTGYQADYMPLAYHPKAINAALNRKLAGVCYVPSVDIVFTNDKSKWTRCPVIELGRTASLNQGGAEAGEMRKSPSVGKDGQPDGTGTGMGWFPGYAVDLETGTRLFMAFGENSFLGSDNGSDMMWNPSDRIYDGGGNPTNGGCHSIWIFGSDSKKVNGYTPLEDLPAYNPNDPMNNILEQKFNVLSNTSSTIADRNAADKLIYTNLMWVIFPLKETGRTILNCDATIELRVNKEYRNYIATGVNGGKPMYSWNMDAIATSKRNPNALAAALAMINVVPNPYYAFSEYETGRLDTRVKITNLPEKCTVKIYTTNGKLVRQFKKDSPVTSLDWDLNNHQRIPVSSGVYLIHVDIPDVGERVLKFFAGMRQVDLQGI